MESLKFFIRIGKKKSFYHLWTNFTVIKQEVLDICLKYTKESFVMLNYYKQIIKTIFLILPERRLEAINLILTLRTVRENLTKITSETCRLIQDKLPEDFHKILELQVEPLEIDIKQSFFQIIDTCIMPMEFSFNLDTFMEILQFFPAEELNSFFMDFLNHEDLEKKNEIFETICVDLKSHISKFATYPIQVLDMWMEME